MATTVSFFSSSKPEIRKSTLLDVKGIWYSMATCKSSLTFEDFKVDDTTSKELFQLRYSPRDSLPILYFSKSSSNLLAITP